VYIFNPIIAAYQYSLSALKIYNARYLYYRFSVLTVNIGTQYFKPTYLTLTLFHILLTLNFHIWWQLSADQANRFCLSTNNS